MRFARFVTAIVPVLLAGLAAAAMPNAKPGLWESVTTTTMEQGLPPDMAGLAKMPAEQRRKLEQAMSSKGAKPTTTSARQCVTPEMIERGDAFASGGDSSCRRTVIDQSPQRVRLTLVCGDGRSTGEAEFTAAGPDHVTGKITMQTRTDRADIKLDMRVEARRISADCGALKPGERTRVGGG
jgi:hypothetical protein